VHRSLGRDPPSYAVEQHEALERFNVVASTILRAVGFDVNASTRRGLDQVPGKRIGIGIS
jgi:hypothetical protein